MLTKFKIATLINVYDKIEIARVTFEVFAIAHFPSESMTEVHLCYPGDHTRRIVAQMKIPSDLMMHVIDPK